MNIRKLRTESLIAAETYMNSRQQWMSAQRVLNRKFFGQEVFWTESFLEFFEFPDELDKYQADLLGEGRLLIIHQIFKYIYILGS